ncbi:hypothetical protein PR202_gb15305 [Eleusine coracana subsp. coracana]|uniref:Uncharacterized protein n=1 Tax=Eleusine coracana subsp. coracana TaxID=191504 RepID=A0AAV5EY14_ELECO|nr:hypothetical protein PR202_gb15305 [Eleusine coracana subsp. coracana]
MASRAAAPAEFTQQDAARQSLIGISQSPPKLGSPDGGMAHAHHAAADGKYRTKLIPISNQSPDAVRCCKQPSRLTARHT